MSYISWSSDIALYFEDYLMYEHHTMGLWVSIWPNVWPQNICRRLWPVYIMVQWFCLISWKLFSGWTSYFGIMSQYHPTSDLKIFLGHCDWYFIVHWLCLIFRRLFDDYTLGYKSVWHNIWPLNKCRSLWSIFHGLVILPYILNSIWCMNVMLL